LTEPIQAAVADRLLIVAVGYFQPACWAIVHRFAQPADRGDPRSPREGAALAFSRGTGKGQGRRAFRIGQAELVMADRQSGRTCLNLAGDEPAADVPVGLIARGATGIVLPACAIASLH
jgi:hypothetical protein